MSKTFQIRNDYFTGLTVHPSSLDAISLNTLKRWLSNPAEIRRVELSALYAMLTSVAGLTDEEALSLKLGDIMAIVGQGD